MDALSHPLAATILTYKCSREWSPRKRTDLLRTHCEYHLVRATAAVPAADGPDRTSPLDPARHKFGFKLPSDNVGVAEPPLGRLLSGDKGADVSEVPKNG